MTNTSDSKPEDQAAASTGSGSDHNRALLEQARLARDERGAALRALAGRLAHQIRNPLAAVRAACSSLRSEINDPEQRETLDLTLTEIDRMLGFVSATVQASPQGEETLQAINVKIEVADVVDIILSGYGNEMAIGVSGNSAAQCMLPRDEFRISVYSLLGHLIGVPSITGIAVDIACKGETAQIRFGIDGASSNDAALSNGMVTPANALQPVGLLVAERFARDLGGRLTRSDDGGTTQSFSLELPCTNV